jgi:hypothetical protein
MDAPALCRPVNRSPVNFWPVTNALDGNHLLVWRESIDHSLIANSDSIGLIAANQFSMA